MAHWKVAHDTEPSALALRSTSACTFSKKRGTALMKVGRVSDSCSMSTLWSPSTTVGMPMRMKQSCMTLAKEWARGRKR